MISAAEAEEVEAWLRRNDFTRRSVIEGRGFGDRLEEWVNGPKLVRRVRDRGQWFVDIGRDAWDAWFELDLVSWVIGSRDDTVIGQLATASAADLDHFLPALRGARQQRVQDLFGWLPPRHPYDAGPS